ncbi:unnamed protein product [Brassica oleracea var. botrytis]
MANAVIFFSNLKTERCSSTVQVRYRFWEARNVPARPERMGVDMLLLDSQYRQRSTAEDVILDISREFEFVEQRYLIPTRVISETADGERMFCISVDTPVDALNTFVCETGTGKHVPRALFIVLEPTVAVMVHLTNLEHINENHMH